MRIADLAQTWQILLWRDEDAIGPNHRFYDYRRYIALILDHVLDILDTGDSATGIGVKDRALVTIHFRSENHARNFASRLHCPAPRIAGLGDRSHGRAVIRTITGNNFSFPGHHASDLESRFVGFGPRSREEEFLDSFRQYFEEELA